MKFFDWLFNRTKERTTFPLDPSLIKENKIIGEQQKKIMTLEAQLSRYKAVERQQRDSVDQKKEENENIENLKRQETEIKDKKYGKAIGLKNFYKELLSNAKFREKIEVTDKDDTTILGNFGDFVIFSNGNMGIIDVHGNVLSYGKSLRSVIYKPESFLNQLRRKRILIPCDKNGVFYPDIEQVEVPELTNIDGKFVWAKMRTKPLKEMILEKQKLINDLSEHCTLIEQSNVDLKRDLDDTKRAIKVYINSADNSKTELSKSMDKSIQFEQRIGEMQMKIVQLMELKSMNERIISSVEEINKELLTKSVEIGVKDEFSKTLDKVKDLLEWSKTQIPKSITNVMPEQKVERPPSQPGEKV